MSVDYWVKLSEILNVDGRIDPEDDVRSSRVFLTRRRDHKRWEVHAVILVGKAEWKMVRLPTYNRHVKVAQVRRRVWSGMNCVRRKYPFDTRIT